MNALQKSEKVARSIFALLSRTRPNAMRGCYSRRDDGLDRAGAPARGNGLGADGVKLLFLRSCYFRIHGLARLLPFFCPQNRAIEEFDVVLSHQIVHVKRMVTVRELMRQGMALSSAVGVDDVMASHPPAIRQLLRRVKFVLISIHINLLFPARIVYRERRISSCKASLSTRMR
nr:MAG TPA: hypothetical protein [Caudoviricetes sp.]